MSERCNACGRELINAIEESVGACAICMNEEIPAKPRRRCKQKLDEVRSFAVALFDAAQRQKRAQPPEIWGERRNDKFRDLPSESVAVWDAVALEAITYMRKHKL